MPHPPKTSASWSSARTGVVLIAGLQTNMRKANANTRIIRGQRKVQSGLRRDTSNGGPGKLSGCSFEHLQGSPDLLLGFCQRCADLVFGGDPELVKCVTNGCLCAVQLLSHCQQSGTGYSRTTRCSPLSRRISPRVSGSILVTGHSRPGGSFCGSSCHAYSYSLTGNAIQWVQSLRKFSYENLR